MHDTTEEGPARGQHGSPPYGEHMSLTVCAPYAPCSVPLRAGGELVVGRHDSCQLSLPNPNLSRFHARFVRRGASVTVEDLGSRQGTWLSGERIQRAELTLGGAVRLADVVIAVGYTAAAARSIAVAKRADPGPEVLYLSARMRKLRELAHRAAQTDLAVVLLGETGTGKELVAREIHCASGRKGPLRALNCGAIPPNLVESTLFGHERGAFTGAERGRPGVFEEANGGTLFLDEIGELSCAAQAALLRVIETRRVSRIGASRELEVDVRIVSATHRDLRAMAAQREFRSDLLHRLCVIALELPPLRERREEIAPLARHFLARSQGVREIDPAALSRLEEHDWPGNVRELRNLLAGAAALASGPCITEADLPESLRVRPGAARPHQKTLLAHPEEAAKQHNLRAELKLLERAGVLQALERTGGNQRCAAALLGLPLRTFERRVQELRRGTHS